MRDHMLSPEIVIGRNEHRELVFKALTGQDHSAEDADFLLWELDRAKLVCDAQLPRDVVRIGSLVLYRNDSGKEQSARLTYDSNISARTISVTSPVGAALIGLRKGQSITWHDGLERRFLTLLDVLQPDC